MPAPLTFIGSPAATPSEPPHDLCDYAGLLGELALTLKWAGKGLGTVYAEGDDPHKARDTALETLLRAYADLARLIDDLAEARL